MALKPFEGVLQSSYSKSFRIKLFLIAKSLKDTGVVFSFFPVNRGGSRAAATPKMECFVIIVNGFQPLTIITKHSILDVAAALDPPLVKFQTCSE